MGLAGLTYWLKSCFSSSASIGNNFIQSPSNFLISVLIFNDPMFPLPFGLTTIEEEGDRKPSQWHDSDSPQFQIRHRSTLSPRTDSLPRFFPKQQFESAKQERTSKQERTAKQERTSHINWTYASKILKYEHELDQYRSMFAQAQKHIATLEHDLSSSIAQNGALAQALHEREAQICQLKLKLEKNISTKKIIKLKQTQKTEALSSRNPPDRYNELLQELEESNIKNQGYLKRIRHLEADRKYEEQRMKNATLSLQLDLKMKENKIARLSQKLHVYEQKFQELMTAHDKQNIRSSKLANALPEKIYDMSNPQSESDTETMHQPRYGLRLKNSTTTTTKRHSRTGSSNLEEPASRRRDLKVVRKTNPHCFA